MVVSAVKVSRQVLLNLNALLVTPFLFACCCGFFWLLFNVLMSLGLFLISSMEYFSHLTHKNRNLYCSERAAFYSTRD